MADSAPPALPEIVRTLFGRFGESAFVRQPTIDGLPTLWVGVDKLGDVLRYLKNQIAKPYKMLYDITALDERLRKHREGQPASDFTVVYHPLSIERFKPAGDGDRR